MHCKREPNQSTFFESKYSRTRAQHMVWSMFWFHLFTEGEVDLSLGVSYIIFPNTKYFFWASEFWAISFHSGLPNVVDSHIWYLRLNASPSVICTWNQNKSNMQFRWQESSFTILIRETDWFGSLLQCIFNLSFAGLIIYDRFYAYPCLFSARISCC